MEWIQHAQVSVAASLQPTEFVISVMFRNELLT